MKKISLLLRVGLFIMTFNIFNTEAQFRLSENQSEAVIKTTEFSNMVRMQNEFLAYINKAIGRGLSLETIRKAAITAVQRNNNDPFYELVFGNVETGQKFTHELALAKSSFLDQNKYIEKNKETFTCSSCKKSVLEEANWFFDNFRNISQARMAASPEETVLSSEGLPTCGSFWNQLKLVACTALCSASTAGLATVLCGWGCWCSFCLNNSTVSSIICAN